MRHGEKEGDSLTPRGIRQVEASARTHLSSLSFTHAVSSGRERAKQTLEVVGKVLHLPEPHIDLEFDYISIEDPQLPQFKWEKAANEWEARGVSTPTVFDVLQHWPPAWLLRRQITDALIALAKRVKFLYFEGEQALVVSHSGVIELAADMDAPGELRPGDIIVYTLDLDEHFHLQGPLQWEVLRCPAVE
jgi:broad specificity phosphatase PhoE